MEQTLIRDVTLNEGRNRGMRMRTYGEASPIDGSTRKLPAELAICKRIGELLGKHYPGHPFMVEVNFVQGLAHISIPVLLGNWAYLLKLDNIANHADFTSAVVKAGGEILERFGIPRSTIDVAAYLKAFGSIPRIGEYRAGDRKHIPG